MEDFVEKRLTNKIRIHWKWLKDLSSEDATKFILAIIRTAENDETDKKQKEL